LGDFDLSQLFFCAGRWRPFHIFLANIYVVGSSTQLFLLAFGFVFSSLVSSFFFVFQPYPFQSPRRVGFLMTIFFSFSAVYPVFCHQEFSPFFARSLRFFPGTTASVQLLPFAVLFQGFFSFFFFVFSRGVFFLCQMCKLLLASTRCILIFVPKLPLPPKKKKNTGTRCVVENTWFFFFCHGLVWTCNRFLPPAGRAPFCP